jgi:hypothetical protein
VDDAFLYTDIRLRHQRNKTTLSRIVPSYLPNKIQRWLFGDCSKLLRFRNISDAPGRRPWLSVLALDENNLLINPAHPDYKRIEIHDLEPLSYDPRMFEKQGDHSRRQPSRMLVQFLHFFPRLRFKHAHSRSCSRTAF